MAVTPTSYYVPSEMTSPRFAQAFARGCGGPMTASDECREGEVAIFGSPRRWPLIQRAMRERRLYYGDHAYFGRSRYYRITRNGYQHDGTGDAGPERFWRFGLTVQPWRTAGHHILICPNGDEYYTLFGLNAARWLAQVREQIMAATDRPIRLRWKRQVREVPIAADLRGAWAVVVFSSNAAVDALLAGVPVFVMAPFAAAARMGLNDLSRIESPRYPDDREPFMWNLAANQWTLDEIAAGQAWRALRRTEEAHAA